MEWYWWLGIVVVVATLTFCVGRYNPTGYPRIWTRAMEEGHWYYVGGITADYACAHIRDEYFLYQYLSVFLPPKEDCTFKEGDFIRWIWRADKKVLDIKRQHQRALAC